MKAAVLYERGGIPRYEDFPDPVAAEGEVIIDVKAVAVENVDRAVAAGTHFAAAQLMPSLPAIPCFDGIGTLPDGTLVGFGLPRKPYGALAEKTVVPDTHVIPAPEDIDPALAVVIGTAITGFAIKTAAGFQPGETVLIQGATGVAGRLAVQVARLLAAGRIVATGRSADALREVGADAVIDTSVDDTALQDAYAAAGGYDVVLDFLWGAADRDPAALARADGARFRQTHPACPNRRVGWRRNFPWRRKHPHLRRGNLRRRQGSRRRWRG